MNRRILGAAASLVLLAGCAGPMRRPEPQPDFSTRVSAFAANVIQGGSFTHSPGGTPDGGIGMTHTAGAVGSPAGAGSASGAATQAMGASAVIVGNVAFVGIDPQVWPAISPTLQQNIRKRVLAQFPQLVEVQVITDPQRATQVARLQQEMHAGVPATQLMDEILGVAAVAR
ncbi:MAG: hypothetical protein K0R39_477 [Symbiobacteriaceae bacterium]|nr:hypothetical protein [Symbiobacteriaceae bacterium]